MLHSAEQRAVIVTTAFVFLFVICLFSAESTVGVLDSTAKMLYKLVCWEPYVVIIISSSSISIIITKRGNLGVTRSNV